MKYFAKVVADVVVQVYCSSVKMSENDCEITEEQFKECVVPCKAVLIDNVIEFREPIAVSDVPSFYSEVEEDISVPEPEPEPTADELMDILLGVNEG